ncbi:MULTISPECIES: hypothetical protein [unclassified Caballeronia]|uniref:hypothetical protein n=1 Tax=unclassified Caballeronia TaxID=2646786 RepID=UPI00285EEB81|nr:MULTISPECIES: hypothetical protein [unclassified Caballeronia]MDR5751085.1 hypothetical protein [Caballeronia sp. LZ024]MDR5844780.1 hypothetical protein [Caballeronia sp. LZ031]
MSRGPKAGYTRTFEPVQQPHVAITGKLNTGRTPEAMRRREHIRGCTQCQQSLLRQVHNPYRVAAYVDGRKTYTGDRCGRCGRCTRRVRDGSCWTCHLARRPWEQRHAWPMPGRTRDGLAALRAEARRAHQELARADIERDGWRVLGVAYVGGRQHVRIWRTSGDDRCCVDNPQFQKLDRAALAATIKQYGGPQGALSETLWRLA